jgi:hypothetical protein
MIAIEVETVIGGVDMHRHTHYAAVIDQHGRLLGHQQFPATAAGYQRLSWRRPTYHGILARPCLTPLPGDLAKAS